MLNKIFIAGFVITVLLRPYNAFSKDISRTNVFNVPQGIMTFGWGNNFIDSESETFLGTGALNLNYISGVTVFFGWRDLEPEENKFDFSSLDKLIALAKAKNKTINIIFFPGANAPKWLFKKGIETFTWERKLKEDVAVTKGDYKQLTSPLPWDSTFLEYWKRFISKVAEKYNGEKTIGYITITGPVIHEAGTGILLKEDADWERFVNTGYTYNKLLNAWKDIVEYYEKVMPDKRLVLITGFNRQGKPDISRSKDIVEYIMKKKYKNISFLCVFLNDTWFLTSKGSKNMRSLLKEAKSNGFTFGYQMAQSAHRNSTWVKSSPMVKSLKKCLETGDEDGASWIEVWNDDIIDPNLRSKGIPNSTYIGDLKGAHQILMKK
ncbi:MAG TPA: beta-galactosidase [Candidatus Brocadiaceae bacterium]